LDEGGRLMESETWKELPNPLDRQLSQILEHARRQALGVDDALQILKDQLDKL
jgi:hypothetical protein